MLSDGLQRYCRLKNIDHMFSFVIVLLLLCLAIIMLMKYQRTALVVPATGSLHSVKLDDLYYWNLHGEWPADTQQAMACLGIHESYPDAMRMMTVVENGAIHVKFIRGELNGKQISFRPVIPANDSLGPVHWRANRKFDDSAYLVVGSDRTNIELSEIPRSLR